MKETALKLHISVGSVEYVVHGKLQFSTVSVRWVPKRTFRGITEDTT